MDLFGNMGFDPKTFLERLEALDRQISASKPPTGALPPKTVKRLLTRIQEVTVRLEDLARTLDPVHHHDIYDPSHPEAAADLIVRKLLEQERLSLGEIKQFWGSGIYALFYTGHHPAYELISGTDVPIYVGRADPARPNAVTARDQEDRLFRRLGEHAKSIRAAERYADAHEEDAISPIRVGEFQVRFLVLASAYAGAVEIALIRHFMPVWNKESRVCYGFGKHGDAAETRSNTRSEWDTLHPGRLWATRQGNIPNARNPAEIQARVIKHIEDYPHFILKRDPTVPASKA